MRSLFLTLSSLQCSTPLKNSFLVTRPMEPNVDRVSLVRPCERCFSSNESRPHALSCLDMPCQTVQTYCILHELHGQECANFAQYTVVGDSQGLDLPMWCMLEKCGDRNDSWMFRRPSESETRPVSDNNRSENLSSCRLAAYSGELAIKQRLFGLAARSSLASYVVSRLELLPGVEKTSPSHAGCTGSSLAVCIGMHMLPLNLMFFPGHQAMLNRGVLRLARLVAEVLDARRISSHSGFGSQVQLDERSCDNCRLGNFQSGSFLLIAV